MTAPASWLAGFDCGRAVGRAEMWRDAHKAGYKIAAEDLTESLTAQIDDQLRNSQTISNRSIVDLVISRTDAQRQRALLEERGLTNV